jgi:hypothetical protein
MLNLVMLFPIVMVTHFWLANSTFPTSAHLANLIVEGLISQLIAHPLWLW